LKRNDAGAELAGIAYCWRDTLAHADAAAFGLGLAAGFARRGAIAQQIQAPDTHYQAVGRTILAETR
jgi:hypothetical protein